MMNNYKIINFNYFIKVKKGGKKVNKNIDYNFLKKIGIGILGLFVFCSYYIGAFEIFTFLFRFMEYSLSYLLSFILTCFLGLAFLILWKKED